MRPERRKRFRNRARPEEKARRRRAPPHRKARKRRIRPRMIRNLVELRLIFYGDMTARRDEFFKNEFHDAVLEDLNIDLTVEFLPLGI